MAMTHKFIYGAEVRTLQLVQKLFPGVFNYGTRINFLQFQFELSYNIVAAVCSITEDERKNSI